MENIGARLWLVRVFAALMVGSVAAAGCGGSGGSLRPIIKTVEVDGIILTARIDPILGRDGPCVRGYVTLENRGKSNIILFRDVTLPKVLSKPDGEAVVFYGLTDVRLPLYRYACWEAYEDLECYVMEPQDSFRYIFTVWNPLDETDPYGNPWYDDSRREHYPPKKVTDPVTGHEDRDPATRLWRSLRLRVGYVNLGKGTLVEPKELDKFNLKIYELAVQVGDAVSSAVDLQQELVVVFDSQDFR